MEMAECELRQRKKEDDGEINLQEDKEEIKSAEQDQVRSENKLEPVRFILLICGRMHNTNFLIHFFYYYYLTMAEKMLYNLCYIVSRICQVASDMLHFNFFNGVCTKIINHYLLVTIITYLI